MHKIIPIHINKIELSDSRIFIREQYFKGEATPILPFFEPMTKMLHYCVLLEDEFFDAPVTRCLMKVSFVFSEHSRVVVSPAGEVYVLAVRNRRNSMDESFYEYHHPTKSLKPKPFLPAPRRKFSAIYFRGCILVVGGQTKEESCSKTCLMFNFRQNRWAKVADLSIAVNNCCLAVLDRRHVLRLGGLNEFDYIDKGIEVYDADLDVWSAVRLSLGQAASDIEFTSEATAVNVSANEVFILGGKNSENFETLEGYLLTIEDIVERQNRPSRVDGSLRRVEALKNGLLCSVGRVASGLGIPHNGAIVILRVGYF